MLSLGHWPHSGSYTTVTCYSLADGGPKRRLATSGLTVADQLREGFPKTGRLMGEADDDVLAHMSLRRKRQTKTHSTNQLLATLLLEQNDDWAMQKRYMSLVTLAKVGDNPNNRL